MIKNLLAAKKKKKGKKCTLEQFSSPRVCFPRARFQAARFILLHFGQAPCSPPIFPPLLPTDQTLLSSLHPCSCCHRPCPPLPFADQKLVSSPHPSALHCCPLNPAIHLKVLLLSWRYCFWISTKLFCWLFSLRFCFGLGSPPSQRSYFADCFLFIFSLV
jgi:hypothetical protein